MRALGAMCGRARSEVLPTWSDRAGDGAPGLVAPNHPFSRPVPCRGLRGADLPFCESLPSPRPPVRAMRRVVPASACGRSAVVPTRLCAAAETAAVQGGGQPAAVSSSALPPIWLQRRGTHVGYTKTLCARRFRGTRPSRGTRPLRGTRPSQGTKPYSFVRLSLQ